MNSPRVSVIIPTYNYGMYISESIQSVLNQSYPDFELIVVDDGSTDQTDKVIKSFPDPRIKYIFQENAGLPAARNTGIRLSSGELLAFLDADDKYHPKKLESHIAFLGRNPEIGITYNGRILIDSYGKPLLLEKAPRTVSLSDLVSGYPFGGGSDMVIRREHAFQIGLFDESFKLNSEDLNFNLRLMLQGYKFAGLEQPLNYRRLYSCRFFRNIPGKMETFLRALDTAFADPRCPPEVLALRNIAYANHFLSLGYQGYVQDEISLGQSYFREAVRLNPTILENKAGKLVEFLVYTSTRDGGDHEPVLRKIFNLLPKEIEWLSDQCDWAVGRGYLIRGMRDIIWQRGESHDEYFARAFELGVMIDEHLLRTLTDQLLNYEMAYGSDASQVIINRLSVEILKIENRKYIHRLLGSIEVNRAFRDFHECKYNNVIPYVFRAILYNPTYIANRGVLSILIRSIFAKVNNKFNYRSSRHIPILGNLP